MEAKGKEGRGKGAGEGCCIIAVGMEAPVNRGSGREERDEGRQGGVRGRCKRDFSEGPRGH